jgi:hypothetical protein
MGLGEDRLRTVLVWLVVILLVVPVGGALWLGVTHGESPCIFCWAQRTSMILMALVALFVVRYGPRPRYVGMLVLLGAWGVFMALRHSGLHLARDVGQGFAGTILGIHTYVWAGLIHWVVLLAAGALLLLLRGTLSTRWSTEPGRTARFAMGLLVVMAGGNAVQAFVSTGPPPYIGQSDPVRMSLDPRNWVWSMDAWSGPVSWRGSWTIPTPDPDAVDADPARGPLADLPTLPVERWERITVPLDGRLTGLAGPAGGPPSPSGGGRVLAVTDRYAVYVLDDAFARVLHRVVLDPMYSIHLTPLAGAAILGGDSLVVMSTNKSWVLLRSDPAADPGWEWRHFRETDGSVSEVRRSRFATVRARQQYALALAYDPAADELVTVSVPSPRHPRMVVSRFDRGDFLLASEFLPRLGPGLLPASEDRVLGDYLVTGAVVVDGVLYAISAAHSTLLAINLSSRTVTAAWAVPGIAEPVGLAIRDGELLVAQADGRVAALGVPRPWLAGR